ncbi:hypothetical protein [Anaerovorax odorimutans]|uniref:hypothetical protein n=1 Tax=Anaerovorax odorimutans TaxID=109327 RepID=UPI00041EB8BD|nr:hypothetical protein [Anaerovorax odorimutans]
MDYTGFKDFPFPKKLSKSDEKIKNFFFSLSDDEQLKLLNGSKSYEMFHERISKFMTKH